MVAAVAVFDPTDGAEHRAGRLEWRWPIPRPVPDQLVGKYIQAGADAGV